jgi:hypothetical protein
MIAQLNWENYLVYGQFIIKIVEELLLIKDNETGVTMLAKLYDVDYDEQKTS